MVEGRRVRVGAVGPAVTPESVAVISPKARLEALGLVYASGSPRVTIEELAEATIKVWRHPEQGYMAEARFRPSSPPIYHRITDDEARLLEIGKPPPELIAHLFEPEEAGIE